MVDWDKVTLEQMMEALKKLVKPGTKGKYAFDVSITVEGGTEDVHVVVDNGALEWGKGKCGLPGAVPFQIKKGGMKTMIRLQEEGLQGAVKMMMGGQIYTTNIPGAQKWFEILVIGKEPLEKALSV